MGVSTGSNRRRNRPSRISDAARTKSDRQAGWLGGPRGTPGRIRTCGLWVRNPTLYPLSYRRATAASVPLPPPGTQQDSAFVHRKQQTRGRIGHGFTLGSGREGRDSNPRRTYKALNRLAGGPIRPLWHLPGHGSEVYPFPVRHTNIAPSGWFTRRRSRPGSSARTLLARHLQAEDDFLHLSRPAVRTPALIHDRSDDNDGHPADSASDERYPNGGSGGQPLHAVPRDTSTVEPAPIGGPPGPATARNRGTYRPEKAVAQRSNTDSEIVA